MYNIVKIKAISLFFIIQAIFVSNIFGNKILTQNYIETYRHIAIEEMKRSGIPASIKMAQAILESDLGRSDLAIQANNHFGIKCGSDWSGPEYQKHDDDFNDDGELRASCFRSFATAEESFRAHSDFITNPNKKARYGFLFELSITDYEGWANGLRFAGYATDPKYPQKLIQIIEKNNLAELDDPKYAGNKMPYLVDKDYKENKVDKVNIAEKKKINIERVSKTSNSAKYARTSNNGVMAILAKGGETVAEIASKSNKEPHEIIEYNEKLLSLDYVLKEGEIVYLEKKKKSYKDEKVAYHTVQKGESLYDISQMYGVRLDNLLSKNNIPKGSEPIIGSKVSLDKNLSKSESPRYELREKFDQYIEIGPKAKRVK